MLSEACPSVCIKMYDLNNGCKPNECGSGCGADEITTFSHVYDCLKNMRCSSDSDCPSSAELKICGPHGSCLPDGRCDMPMVSPLPPCPNGLVSHYIGYPTCKWICETKKICCKITPVVLNPTPSYSWLSQHECITNIGTNREIVSDINCESICISGNTKYDKCNQCFCTANGNWGCSETYCPSCSGTWVNGNCTETKEWIKGISNTIVIIGGIALILMAMMFKKK